MDINHIKNNRYIRDLNKNIFLIVAVISIMMFFCFVYLIFQYKPIYTSQAKVLIKDISHESFITDFASDSILKPLTSAGNPILTQMEILKSRDLEEDLNKFVKVKLNRDEKVSISSILKHKTKPGTDVLALSLNWHDPAEAKFMLEFILKKYEEKNLELAKRIKIKKRKYIDQKIQEIEPKLTSLRKKIKHYTSKNKAINLDEQSRRLIGQKISLSTKLSNINAELSKAKGEIKSLQKQIGIKPSDALNAVALGAKNTNLVNLKSQLNSAIQQYQYDSTRLADTNPNLVAQKNKIETIKKQIADQVNLSIGKNAKGQNIGVFDSVREKLIQDMVSYQAKVIGLRSERWSVKKSIKKLDEVQSQIPQKQFELNTLLQEEKTLSSAYNQLREKQIEAKIQEAEAVSNISIVDKPSFPEGQSFPRALHILVAFFAFGCFLSILFSFIKTYIEDVCDDVDFIEKITGTNIIGTVPWHVDFDDEDKIEFMDKIAYNNIISSLVVKSYNHNAKILAFTSTSIKKPQSAILYKIAQNLVKLGHSVLIMDTDFRIPSILKCTEGLEDNLTQNFSDVILNLEEKIKRNEKYSEQEILDAIGRDKNGVNVLANNKVVFEPYEFFGTLAYRYIISTVRDCFDWILVDTSSAHISPEFKIVSQNTDGVTVFINKTATYSDLYNLTRSLKRSEIPIIGAIIRQRDPKLEKEYENYLRHQFEKLGGTDALINLSLDEEEEEVV